MSRLSDSDISGRVDNVKKHFKKLIVWSKTHEGEAAEVCESEFKSAPKEAKQHTKWCNTQTLACDKVNRFTMKVNVVH